jgi:hypothetical protein
LVQIAQEADGTLSGKIVKGLAANDPPDRHCTACTDAQGPVDAQHGNHQRHETGRKQLKGRTYP